MKRATETEIQVSDCMLVLSSVDTASYDFSRHPQSEYVLA